MAEEKKYADFPSYLSDKIMRGVAFIYNFNMKNDNDLQKLNDGVKLRLEFLEEKEGYTRKELRYILLLLALPEVDEILRKSDILEKAFAEFTIKRYNIH
jgi:hypothetical protein